METGLLGMNNFDSLFRLTSLIYAEKFEEGRKRLFFVDKSKKRNKVNINNIQGYDTYKINKVELSGDVTKFPPVQWHYSLL